MKSTHIFRSGLSALPVLTIWANMFYDIFLNITQRLLMPKKMIPADGLLPAPDIVLNWFQILVGIGISMVVSFAFWVVLNLNQRVIAKWYTPIGTWRAIGLTLSVLFSLPAVWEIFWMVSDLLHWHSLAVNWLEPRYIVVALCMPYLLFLTIKRIYDNRKLRPCTVNDFAVSASFPL